MNKDIRLPNPFECENCGGHGSRDIPPGFGGIYVSQLAKKARHYVTADYPQRLVCAVCNGTGTNDEKDLELEKPCH